MARQFFAICRDGNNQISVLRIPIVAGVQSELEELFDNQEEEFLRDRDDLVEFDEGWEPDSNQLQVIQDNNLAIIFTQTLRLNTTNFEDLHISNYQTAGIKGIFTRSKLRKKRILLQSFQQSQYLYPKKRYALYFNGEEFGKVSKPGFTIGNKLTAIIEGDSFKFVSFRNLRAVIPIQHHFIEATDSDVTDFLNHPLLHIEDPEKFRSNMDEISRKLINCINQSEILENYNARDIQAKARKVGLNVRVYNKKIVIPEYKRELKTILRFLVDSVFKGTFSDETYETNSKRRRRVT